MKKFISIFSLGFLTMIMSCQKVKRDAGETAAVKVANEWWVTLTQDGQDIGAGHFKMATYNTSGNDNNIWVDDYQNGWQFKIKTPIDYNNLTFSTTAAPNEYYNITVNLTEGKILPKLGHSKAGNVVDSIQMKLEFSDDPGTIYEMNGVERTRFPEDDY